MAMGVRFFVSHGNFVLKNTLLSFFYTVHFSRLPWRESTFMSGFMSQVYYKEICSGYIKLETKGSL